MKRDHPDARSHTGFFQMCSIMVFAGTIFLGAASPQDSLKAAPIMLDELEACDVLNGDAAAILIAIHSDYLQSWFSSVAPRLDSAMSEWRGVVAPRSRLPTIASAQRAVNGLIAAIDAAAACDSDAFQSAGVSVTSPECRAELTLAELDRIGGLWNVPDMGGNRIAGVKSLRAGLRWSTSIEEREQIAQWQKFWNQKLRVRASHILQMPVQFTKRASAEGIVLGGPVSRLSSGEMEKTRQLGGAIMTLMQSTLSDWWKEAITASFRAAKLFEGNPALNRTVKLALYGMCQDQELRGLADRELSALSTLSQSAGNQDVRNRVYELCRELNRLDEFVEPRVIESGSQRRASQPEPEMPAAGPRPVWISTWRSGVDALELLARELGLRAQKTSPSDGRTVLLEWERAIASTGVSSPRDGARETDWGEWAGAIVCAQGMASERWQAAVKEVKSQSSDAPRLRPNWDFFARGAADVDGTEPAIPSKEEIERARKGLLQELREQIDGSLIELRLACSKVELSLESAEIIENAWLRRALSNMDLVGSVPSDLAAASSLDLIELGLHRGMNPSHLKIQIIGDYVQKRQALLKERTNASSAVLACLSLEAFCRMLGVEEQKEDVEASIAARVRADKVLREMLTLNETTAEWMESSADAILRDTAAVYRQQSFGAGAVLEVSIRKFAPDLLNDIALVDALRTLRHNRMQRLIASDSTERQKYDTAISATVTRIAHQIDLRSQPIKR